jgi:hypothetical protein
VAAGADVAIQLNATATLHKLPITAIGARRIQREEDSGWVHRVTIEYKIHRPGQSPSRTPTAKARISHGHAIRFIWKLAPLGQLA